MSKDAYILLGAFLAVVLVAATVLVVPLVQIWALNTLFKLNIEYNLINWFAVVILNSFWTRVQSK